MMPMEKPLFTLQPNITVAIIPVIVTSIFIGVFAGAFIGFWARSMMLGFSVGIIVMVLLVFLTLMNLRARRYVFYKDKAEFYEGFLTIVQRTVNYNKVTDCMLRKTVWDRMFGTGTIRLITAGHLGGQGEVAIGGGLMVQYIEHPDDIFQKVQKLLHGK